MLCQERMNSLETMCNIFSSQLSNHFKNDLKKQTLKEQNFDLEMDTYEEKENIMTAYELNERKNEFVSEFVHFQEKLDFLTNRYYLNIDLQQSLFRFTNIIASKEFEKMDMLIQTKIAKNTSKIFLKSIGTQSLISAANIPPVLKQQKKLSKQIVQKMKCNLNPPLTIWHRLKNALKDVRFSKFFLSCSLFVTISVLWLTWLDAFQSPSQNNLYWKFGPQLDYVNGPPPV